jgi:hypothetical protein
MNFQTAKILLVISSIGLGFFIGLGIAHYRWKQYLVNKNVAEWQVNKNGMVHFVIKPQGEPL